VVRIHAHREQNAEHKERRGYRSEFRVWRIRARDSAPSGCCGGHVQQRGARSSDPMPGEDVAQGHQGSVTRT
jgi:hypothetical protein